MFVSPARSGGPEAAPACAATGRGRRSAGRAEAVAPVQLTVATCTPRLLAGRSARRRATRTPLADARSGRVWPTSLGNGSRQRRRGVPSQRPSATPGGAAKQQAGHERGEDVREAHGAPRYPQRPRNVCATVAADADAPPQAEPAPLSGAETERVRTRVRLMVELTARAGAYRSGFAQAARRLTPRGGRGDRRPRAARPRRRAAARGPVRRPRARRRARASTSSGASRRRASGSPATTATSTRRASPTSG